MPSPNIFSFTAPVVATVLSLTSILAKREQGRAKISAVYRMERSLIDVAALVALAMALTATFLLIQARYYHGHHGSDLGAPAALGIISAICAYVWSVYEVRFDEADLRLGLYARVSVPYASIKEICEIRGQGSPRANLTTTSGRVFKVWSNLVGFDHAMDQLRSRCPGASFRIAGPRSGKPQGPLD